MLFVLSLAACGQSLSRFADDNAEEAMSRFKDFVGNDVEVVSVEWFVMELRAEDKETDEKIEAMFVFYYITYEVDGSEETLLVQYYEGSDDDGEHSDWEAMSTFWYGTFEEMRDMYVEIYDNDEWDEDYDNYRFRHAEGTLSSREINRYMND